MIEAWITQLRKGLLEYCVLTVLSRGASYGYEIVADLGKIDGLAASESTVYPILARLRQEKFLKLRDVPSAQGPTRRYFSLTAIGKVRLAEMNNHLNRINRAISQLKPPPRKDPDHDNAK
ncbi:MAG: PadR family transcriptional regulator [Verrucomicrobia bacterium]|nr:PadR family transcriptional regulator [Verrucomicrobiota bacterium]